MVSEYVTLKYNNLLVVFDSDIYRNLIPLTGWTVKLGQGNYPSVRATKKPYVGTRLARLILNCSDAFVVDHINGNSLDNRKSNLRAVTLSQNQFNRVVSSSKTSKLPKGVYYNSRCNNWYAQIRVEGRRIHLGSFSSPQLAETAYIKSATNYHGHYSHSNSRG